MRFAPAEVRGIAVASEILCSPLAYDDAQAWLGDAIPAIAKALHADMFTAAVPIAGTEVLLAEGIDLEVLRTYLATYLPAAQQKWGMLSGQLAAGAFSRAMIYGERLRDMYRSEYWHDFLVPNRCFDTVGLTLALGSPGTIANVQFYHGSPRGQRFGERGLAALRILWPSFVAGTRTAVARPPLLRGLADAVEEEGVGVLVADRRGRELYRNAAISAMLDDEPAHGALRGAMRDLLVAGRAMRGAESPLRRRSAHVDTGGGRYDLVAWAVPALDGGRAFSYLVTIRPVRTPPTTVESRLAPFGLTARERDVALLLMRGASNRKIASELGMSPYTARHHTEHVLSKLGVRSRAEVLPRIQRDSPQKGGEARLQRAFGSPAIRSSSATRSPPK